MTTQLATQASGQPVGHRSVVSPPDAYVYDIEHRSGLAMPKIMIADLEAMTMPVKDMGEAIVCPVATGACVSSAAGGDVSGYDMYGQWVTETVAAAGTSTIAFASVVEAPEDIAWVNQFGLPYKYDADAAVPNADVTITPPADDEDARGTFAYGGAFVDLDPFQFTEVEVPYMVDRDNVFGTPYMDHTDNVVGSAPYAVTGTIDAAGEVVVTLPAPVAGAATGVTITFPDGTTMRANLGDAAITHQLSPIWISQYARNLTDDDLDRLVAVGFDDTRAPGVYVELAGTAPAALSGGDDEGEGGMEAMSAPATEPVTEPSPWSGMTTHAQINDYVEANSIDVSGEPTWSSMTISEKKAWLDANAA